MDMKERLQELAENSQNDVSRNPRVLDKLNDVACCIPWKER